MILKKLDFNIEYHSLGRYEKMGEEEQMAEIQLNLRVPKKMLEQEMLKGIQQPANVRGCGCGCAFIIIVKVDP